MLHLRRIFRIPNNLIQALRMRQLILGGEMQRRFVGENIILTFRLCHVGAQYRTTGFRLTAGATFEMDGLGRSLTDAVEVEEMPVVPSLIFFRD
jgi:hypothetical protein